VSYPHYRKLGTVGDFVNEFVKNGMWPVDQGVLQDCDFVPDRNDAGEI
jgi:hypothetical protein